MKKLVFGFSIILAFLFISCKDQNETKGEDNISPADVPAAVSSAFTAKYSGVTDVQWERAKENDLKTYKAKFKKGNEEMTAEFEENGTFIKEKDAN